MNNITIQILRKHEQLVRAFTRYTPTQIVKVINSADSAFKKKDYKKALERYKNAAMMDEKQAYVWFKMGLSFYMLENYHDAIRAYDKGLSLKKNYDMALNKGIVHLQLKDFDGAESAFKLALSIDNGNEKPEPWVQLARTYIAKKDYKKALKHLEKSEERKPSSELQVLINYFRGNIFYAEKKVDNAIEAYQSCLNLNPAFKDAVMELSLLYFEKGSKDLALRVLTEYLKKAPEQIDIWRIRGEIHASLHDYKNSQFSFEQAIHHDKEFNIESHIGLAKALAKQDLYTETKEQINLILEKDPKNLNALVLDADLLWIQGNKHQTINHLKENALFYYPNDSAIQRLLTDYLIQMGEFSEALSILLKLYDQYPDDWGINLNLGQIFLQEEQNSEQALTYLDKALKLADDANKKLNTYIAYGQYYFKREKWDLALNNFKLALKIEDNNQLVVLFYAKTMYRSQNHKDLQKWMKKQLTDHPDDLALFQNDPDLKTFLESIKKADT